MARKKKEDNENSLTTFYYNHKILIWILIIVLLVILLLKVISNNKTEIVPTDYDINLKIENKDYYYVGIGNSINLKASVNVEDAKIIWTSSDEKVARVNNGTVTGVNFGKAKIMVSYIDTKGNKYVDSCDIEVVEGDENVRLNSISFPEGDLYMQNNKDYRLDLILNPSNALVNSKNFVSSNESVVSVTNDGIIRSHKEGKARIIANINGRFQTSINVYVDNNFKQTGIVLSPESISFDYDTRKIKLGSSEKLYYSITPSNASRNELIWTSDEPSIVSVNSEGVIKGVNEGETIVSVETVNGLRANVVVEVYRDIVPVEDITISTDNITMAAGKTMTITPVVRPSNASNKGLSYASVDPSIVSVSVSGLGDSATLSALKKGNTTIIVRSGNIEKRINVTVTGENNNSEVDENELIFPTTIVVRSNKNNLAKTYNEAVNIPVGGTTEVTVTLSTGVGKIKYCYAKYSSTSVCKPSIEKYANTTITIPSGDLYVLRIIKYDYNDKEISSSSANYHDGALNYYINTRYTNTKLYMVTGAYENINLANQLTKKIGDKVTIKVNASDRHLSVCYATGKSCVPNTRVNTSYTITLNNTGTTRIYVNEYDSNNNKIGNTEVYYVVINATNTNTNTNNNNTNTTNNTNNTNNNNNTNEQQVIPQDNTTNSVKVNGLSVYNEILIGKYLTATVNSSLTFNEARFCYKTVNKGATGTCNLDLSSSSVPAHNGQSYYHPIEENKTYYATFASTTNKVFWFDIDGLDHLYDNSDTNHDVIFEFAVKSSKGYSGVIKVRINMVERNGSTSTWKSVFIK